MPPRVSIILPVFNGARFLPETLNRVFNQTESDIEIITVDDGSSDDSLSLLRSYREQRLTVIARKENGGVSIARNQAINVARGKYLAFLAQDDHCTLNRLERQAAVIDQRPDLAFLGANVRLCGANGDLLSNQVMPHLDQDMRWAMCFDTAVRHSTLMVRRSFVEHHNLAYDPKIRVGSDHDFVFKLMTHGKGENLQEFLVDYVLHDHNASRIWNEEYFETGNRLAQAWIRQEFPDQQPPTIKNIGLARQTFRGFPNPIPLSAKSLKQASQTWLNTRELFDQKYGH